MGASGGGYRCDVAEIRDATWDDFDAVFGLLDARSRAAFGISEQQPAFLRGRWEPGFKFLPVAYESKLEDYYLPATLDATDYPGLVKPGERVTTIAVPTALVAFNWPVNSNRFERVARFVDHLFSRIDKLQAPGFDPKWKSINLAATVPGLTRFPAAQVWLDGHARAPQASQ